jgi:hypothetical protein
MGSGIRALPFWLSDKYHAISCDIIFIESQDLKMTDKQLTKLEEEISDKIRAAKRVRPANGKFVMDVPRIKELAVRLRQYEAQSHATTQ